MTTAHVAMRHETDGMLQRTDPLFQRTDAMLQHSIQRDARVDTIASAS
jgi:hypothetical protein